MLLRTVLVIALASAPAGAQPVDSFSDLAELIEIGRSVVVVTSPDGDVITGQLVDISPASLSVFAGGRRIELDEARVRRVRQGWNDPIADGAALGCQATLKTDPLATPKTDPRRNGVYSSTTVIPRCNPRLGSGPAHPRIRRSAAFRKRRGRPGRPVQAGPQGP